MKEGLPGIMEYKVNKNKIDGLLAARKIVNAST